MCPLRPKIPSVVFLVVIAFAVFGLVINLTLNPMNLLKTLLIGLGVALILYLALQFIQNRRNGNSSDEMKKYKAAVKQSRRVHNKQQVKPNKSNNFRIIKKTKQTKKPSHLTVIEGKKSNDKN